MRRAFGIGAALAPVFLLPAALLLLDRAGVVDLDPRIDFHRSLVVNLVLYWMLATALVAAVVERAALAALARANRLPLMLMAVSFVLSFLVVEVGVRVLQPAESLPWKMVPSPLLHHRNIHDHAATEHGVVIRTNEDGFRSAYSRAEFLTHDVRVAVLGDSFTFGQGVEADQIATSVLERALREKLGTDSVAVLNTGTVSYSPLIERTLFRAAVRHYRPTVTLLILDGNDIGDDWQYEQRNVGSADEPRFDLKEYKKPAFEIAALRLLAPAMPILTAPFEILRRFRPGARDRHDYYNFELEIGGVVETNRWFILRHPPELTRPYFERTLDYVRDVAADARAAGSEFVLVVSPRFFHWNDDECPENWTAHRYAVDEPYEYAYLEFFEEAAERVDFPVFPLLPAFEASDEFPLVFSHDPHWNAAGHRLVGEALASHLVDSKLLR